MYFAKVSPKRILVQALFTIALMTASIGTVQASDTYKAATSADIHKALKAVKPGDTIMLEGGKVYEIEKTLKLDASGTEKNRITFTSTDPTGKGRYAIITTVDQRKENSLFAFLIRGAYWNFSRIEISGKKVPLNDTYWDTNGFQLGLYLLGPGSHHNVVEDVHIHHTHNAAVAVRRESHHNIFRRMHIHDIGEWLDADYNAHEGEGFYLGSSKGFDEDGNKAKIHNILIEDSIIGPGLLGQYIDIKYGSTEVTARNNTIYSTAISYNEEVVKLAGYNNLIENNKFIGFSESLTRYIHLFNKKTKVPVRVDYKGEKNIPSPTGRDNTIINNVFYTDNPNAKMIEYGLTTKDRASTVFKNNKIEPLKSAP